MLRITGGCQAKQHRLSRRPALEVLLIAGIVALLLPGMSTARTAAEIDALVSQQLAAMTVEEKVGQMTQLTLGALQSPGQANGAVVDPARLTEAIQHYGIGSIINVSTQPLSVREWHALLRTIQDAAGKTRRGIPIVYGIDAIHGASYTRGSTLFPHNIGLAAARDPDLVSRLARVTAMEVRASGIRWNFDPVLDAGRNPLWARFEETFGEDAYLTSTLGVAVITAYEGDGLDSPTAVAATMKHFVGYSDPHSGKDRTPAYIPAVELWEQHLPSFRAAVAAGASTIMINSSSINGMPLHADKHLLTDVLRGQLGFDGLVVSDWEDVIRLHTRHRVADTPREAVRLAVDAGIDMSMVPNDYSFAELLTELVHAGDVSEERIDRSVERILELKYRLGLFDNPYPEAEAAGNFGREEYADLALEAAEASITLLRNEHALLPLAADTKVLVAGPAAANHGALHGSWSYSWQGNAEALYPESTKTVSEGLAVRGGRGNVRSISIEAFDDPRNVDASMLADAARTADVIVLALGEPAYAESPGAINDLALAPDQLRLADAALATGKPLVIVMLAGRPRLLGHLADDADAIVYAYRPGSRGGDAIARILYGDTNPGGMLPFSYPRHSGDLVPYDRRVLADVSEANPGETNLQGYHPQWPFGFGLSYTTFETSGLTLGSDTLAGDESLQVHVQVTNTGDRDGHRTVELYVRDVYASLSPAARKLRRFQKVFVPRGATVDVAFTLDKDDMSFVNSDLQRVTEPGQFRVMVGDEVAAFTYRQ